MDDRGKTERVSENRMKNQDRVRKIRFLHEAKIKERERQTRKSDLCLSKKGKMNKENR